MSDNHDLLKDKDVCSNKDAVACGDGSTDVKER